MMGPDQPPAGVPVDRWIAWLAGCSDSAIGNGLAELLAPARNGSADRQQFADWVSRYFREVTLPSIPAESDRATPSGLESIPESLPMSNLAAAPPPHDVPKGAEDPAERTKVDLDALQVLAGAELVQRRLLAGLSMGTPSFERSTYLIKTRIKEHSKIVDKVFVRRKTRPDYRASDVSDVIGLRILTLYRSDLPGLLQRFLKFVDQARGEPLDLFPSGSIEEVIEEVIVYGYPQEEALCQALLSQLKRFGLAPDGRRYRYERKDTGYSSIHLLLHAQASTGETVLSVPVEVQIRTVLEDAWGEVQHELIYKSRMGTLDPTKRKLMENAQNQLRNWKEQLDNSGNFADTIKELIKEIFSSPSDLGPSFQSVDDEELTNLELPPPLQRRVNDAVTRIDHFYRDYRNPTTVPTVTLVEEVTGIVVILQGVLEQASQDSNAHYWLTMEIALCLLWLGRLLRERPAAGSNPRVFESVQKRLQEAHVMPPPKNPERQDQEGASDYTFGADALDEAASRYFALEPTNPDVPLIAYRLGEVFSARGEADMALAKFEEAFQLLKTASVTPQMSVQIPRRLGFAYWEAAEHIRRRAKSVRNPDLALHKRRDFYLRAVELTKLAYQAAKKTRGPGAGQIRPGERDELQLTVNNLLSYCTEFLRAKGQLSELAEKQGLDSKALQELLNELIPHGNIHAITDPGFADTVRDAARYFGQADLERAAAKRVKEILASREWLRVYKPEVIADMAEDADASLARLA
jgi:ppGpp synthetase/RelA/SpoT-type nucleotidyltranferase